MTRKIDMGKWRKVAHSDILFYSSNSLRYEHDPNDRALQYIIDLPSLGKVNYYKVLDKVFKMIATRYNDQYRPFLRVNDNSKSHFKDRLLDTINLAVIYSFEDSMHCIEDLVPFSSERKRLEYPGVYLHILCKSRKVFWLYIRLDKL